MANSAVQPAASRLATTVQIAVPVEVDLLAFVPDQTVDLHPARVGGEDVAAPAVVVGVDEDLQGCRRR